MNKNGFRILDENVVEFTCSTADYPDLSADENVYLTGSFTSWQGMGDASLLLKKTSDKKNTIFSLQKPFNQVNIPGNSGFPEFQLVALSKDNYHFLKIAKEADNVFSGNRLVLVNNQDYEELKNLKQKAIFTRSLDSFDLNCPACRSELANFRLVPGTKCLFRGYDPYKKSNPELDTEEERLHLVQKACELYGIKTDITLNGYELASQYEGEVMPDFIKDIENKKNRLCVNMDYNLVCYHPDTVEYMNILQKIAKFMLERNGPYFIHCRMGSDRTGITSAVFACLCGATWEQIASDYEKTNAAGINEFRSKKLLQYSLKKMLGFDPADSKDLAHLMQSFFIKEQILNSKEIELLIKKLNALPKRKETDYFDFTKNHICARRSANI